MINGSTQENIIKCKKVCEIIKLCCIIKICENINFHAILSLFD